jgi:hypothetical protein
VALVTSCAAASAVLAPVMSPSSGAAVAPEHLVSVSGVGVGTYPAFDPTVARYAVTTAPETGGTVTVSASTTDPQGTVLVNGQPAPGGQRTVTGLEPGDEVSVLITDAGGTVARSFVYLPAEFPELRRTTPADRLPLVEPGHVLLTLGRYVAPSPFFETAVDAHGVPAYVRSTARSMDLRRQPNGGYSVARGAGVGGADIVELDAGFREVRRLRTRGLVHTDGHDAILLPDGSAYLLAYEPNPATGLTDAIIQHLDASGEVLFQWSSADHVDIAAETVVGENNPDYAHINSVEVMDDGDLLVSFRHLSSVFKIARTAHDGFDEGEVVWRLGGRASDFSFTDTAGWPDGGPCAQHTATQLPNGDVMVFDNGAWQLEALCIDPADVAGPPVPRTPTRIAQWSLDETEGAMSATMVKDFQVEAAPGQGRYAIFAGSAQPLDNGNTVVGWASATQAVASELSPTGEVLWELVAPEDPKYFSYRAFKTVVPDAIDPDVQVSAPVDGADFVVGDTVVPDLECTDRGGSNLQSCAVTGLDTSTAGTRTMTVTARDGAGNETTVRRSYTVTAAPPVPGSTPSATPTPAPTPAAATYRSDLHLKAVGQQWRGRDAHDVRRGQVARRSSTEQRSAFVVRVQNDGTVTDRFLVRLRTRASVLAPRWAGRERRTVRLDPGESATFRLVILREPRQRRAAVTVVARSAAEPASRDRVWARTTWR